MYRKFLMLFFCSLLFPCTCFGTSYEDLLDQLDSAMSTNADEEPAEQKSQSGLHQLADHLAVSLTLNYGHMFENIGREDDTAEARLDFSTYGGTDRISVHLSGWMEAGSQDRTYAGISSSWRDDDRHRNFIEINELYGLFNFGNLELSMGRKVFPGNSSQLYSPGRVYHPLDLNDPLNPKTLGVWHGSADYSFGDVRVFLGIFPVFQEHKIPDSESRWMPWQLDSGQWFEDEFRDSIKMGVSISDIYRFLYYFTDVLRGRDILRNIFENRTIVFEENLPDTNFSDMGYMAEIKGSAGMWDLYATYYHGPCTYPMFRVENRPAEVALIREYPGVHRVGGGFSTTWKGLEFHGEASYSHSESRRDDRYAVLIGGITYLNDSFASVIGCDRLEISLNFGKEYIVSRQNADEYYFSSETIRPFKKDIIPSLTLLVNEDLTLYYLTDQDLKYDSQYHRAGLKYRLLPGLVSDIYLESFDGDDRSFIGQWRDNDRVSFVLKWTL